MRQNSCTMNELVEENHAKEHVSDGMSKWGTCLSDKKVLDRGGCKVPNTCSRLDVINAILFEIPDNLLNRLQLIQNHPARIVRKATYRYCYVTLLPKDLSVLLQNTV